MAAHNVRTAIPVLRDEPLTADRGTTQDLLNRLDVVLGVRRQLAAVASAIPGSHTSYEPLLYIPGSAETLHTVQWWGTKWKLRAHDEMLDGERRYRLYDDFGEVLALVWPRVEAVAPVSAVEVSTALRSWRPADAGLDALGHWTDDKTDEERAMRERMEAGHA